MRTRKTVLYTHPAFLGHQTVPGHPECPERLLAVNQALDGERFSGVDRRVAPIVDPEDLNQVHPIRYVNSLLDAIPEHGLWHLDPDTVVSPGSGEAAFRACGAICAAVEAVIEEPGTNAFCAVRPPGHHAEAESALGFCLFNNIAVGAFAARRRHGLRRIAVVDFDVHHGNGIQSMFWDEPDFLYISLHQSPFDPWTGAEEERGVSNNILNIPLAEGTDSKGFRSAVMEKLLPRLRSFGPDLLLVCAGFDGHRLDPLGGLNLTDEDFAWIGKLLRTEAEDACQGRLVAALEGGYDLAALGTSVAAFVSALLPEDA